MGPCRATGCACTSSQTITIASGTYCAKCAHFAH